MTSSAAPVWALDHIRASSGDSDAIAAAEAVERRVFAETFGYDDGLWSSEYSPYDDRSVWITLRHLGTTVGALRVIVGPPSGLKMVEDLDRFWGISWDEAIAAHGLTPDVEVIECATLSVLPEHRSKDRWWPVKMLCSSFGHFVVDSGATHGIQLLDPNVRKVLVMVLGLPFDPFAGLEPVDYHGLLLPVVSRVADYPSIINTSDDEYRRLYVERDESGRGGTRLPPVDLSDDAPTALHRALCRASVDGAR